MAEISNFSKDTLTNVFNGRLHAPDRFLYPTNPRESIESRIVDRFTQLREKGAVTFVDGAFDVPHNNHEWYLRHCRVIGAFATFQALHDADAQPDEFMTHVSTAPELLRTTQLAVTVDADSKVAAKKSGIGAKGGVQRPIYPWIARAERLAGYHFEYNGALRQTVDLVTVEGDPEHTGTPLESSLALAAFLKSEDLLDTFIIYGEHDKTVSEADSLDLSPVIIEEGAYELNPQTDREWSSSNIIRRAQGSPVPHPITRPSGL